jgi:type I restriction-modification system DNA methylase subunit
MDSLEAKLWAAADTLRNNMDAAEHKHVLGTDLPQPDLD